MPTDIRELTLKIKVTDRELVVLGTKAKKVGDEFEKSGKRGTSTFSAFNTNLKGVSSTLTSLIKTTLKWGSILSALAGGITFGLLIRQGLRFQEALETGRLGIAAILASTQQVTDQFGNVVTGARRFAASLAEATRLQERLQIINLETSATFREILQGFQGLAAPAAANNLNLEQTLELTKLIVQSTKAIGLEQNQIVQEGRDLLIGAIDRNSQLARSLNISNEQLKIAKEQGKLFDFLTNKLTEFARAGEETRFSFRGILSNLQDAVEIAAGRSLTSGLFEEIKRIGLELQESIVTFEDGVIRVNPAVEQVAEAIDREIVIALRSAEEAAEDFVNALDPQQIDDSLRNARIELGKIIGGFADILDFLSQHPEVVEFGLVGLLIDGRKGLVAGALGGLGFSELFEEANKELEQFGIFTEKTTAEVIENIENAIKASKQRLDDLGGQLRLPQSERGVFGPTPRDLLDQIDAERQLLQRNLNLRQQILTTLGEGAAQQEDINGILGTASSLLRGVSDNLQRNQVEADILSERYQGVVDTAYRAFTFTNNTIVPIINLQTETDIWRAKLAQAQFAAAGIQVPLLSALAIVRELNGSKLTFTPNPVPPDLTPDGDAKRAARERERIEETLTRDINRITLDREDFERKELEKTLDKARAAGVSQNLIDQRLAAEQVRIIKERDKELDALLKKRTQEQERRNKEIVNNFEKIEFDFLPEPEQLRKELDERLAEIKAYADAQALLLDDGERRAQEARLAIIEEYNGRIQDALRREEIERLRESGGFFDGLEAGWLEFVDSVENNGELASQFFADVLSQMSQNFSDLFFNVLTGKFDDLKDLAKQAFEAILRSFLDLVSAIATRQIVISIAGSFGANTKGASAFDVVSGGAGAAGDIIGGIGGGATSPLTQTGGLLEASGALDVLPTELGGGAGFLSGIGGIGGALGIVGAIASIATVAVSLLGGAFKKTPRLDLDFDQFRDEFGKSLGIAAEVQDFLDQELFKNEIFSRSVSRKAGLGLGSELPNVIREAIEGQISAIQGIINQLPADIAAQLNESLLNTAVDIESTVKGDRLLEFDETKKIAEKFQQFIEGDLQARFTFAIRDFFVGAFESLGVLSDSAQSFIDSQFEEFQNLSGREARAEFGAEFLGSFQTLVDAFNVLNDNGVDSIGATVSQVKNLANTLGFEAVPSIDELDRGLEELISAAELDPDLIQDFLDLRSAITQVQSAILNSISSIISNIQSLNSTITSIGGSGVDLTGFINDGLSSVFGLLSQDGLSLEDREALLGQAQGFANQLLAEEQAAFAAAQEQAQQAAQARADRQREVLEGRIDGLEREKDLISENFKARIEALQEELQIAQDFERLTESIKRTLEGILFSPQSVLTSIEQVNLAQSNVADLQRDLANASDPARRVELIEQLESAFSTLFSSAGEAFGVNSPEFVAIFDQVTGGLQDLQDLTETSSRSVEEINAEIEALNLEQNRILEGIDAQIESARDRISSIQAQNVEATFQASDRVREALEFLRNEYLKVFEERMAQLEEVTDLGFSSELEGIAHLVESSNEQTTVLRSIEGLLSGVTGFADGSGGFRNFGTGTLAMLHGREAVIREGDSFGSMNVNINVNVEGGSNAAVHTVATNIEDMLARSIRRGGKLRSAVREASSDSLN